jgi:hypothetical protein
MLTPLGQDFFGGAAGLVAGIIKLGAQQDVGHGRDVAGANGVVERFVKTQKTFVRRYFDSGSRNGTVIIHGDHQRYFGFGRRCGRFAKAKVKSQK